VTPPPRLWPGSSSAIRVTDAVGLVPGDPGIAGAIAEKARIARPNQVMTEGDMTLLVAADEPRR
jgi:hypothetical protein